MKRVLISWIGQNDLNAFRDIDQPESLSGPLMSTCQALKFSDIFLLYNYKKSQVSPYLGWLNDSLGVKPRASYIKLSSPIAFGEIYQAVDKFLHKVVEENKGSRLSILLSPGTPAMQAVSILLGKTRYSVDFIQSSVEQGVQEITLPFDITAEFIPERLQQQDEQLKAMVAAAPVDTAAFDNIITNNKNMQRLKQQAAILAQRDVPVLIYGESGTGKELFARAIHNASPRSKKPFIAVNCGAIPPELIDSTLFGYSKGAFTGATKDTPGQFEAAHTGTLFLDEFGELTKDAQVRLLRVLQENKITPVGSTKEKTVEVRIIAATNKNLSEEMVQGRFREDLFYRVAVGVLNLPPLRERKGDLGLLSQYLLEEINQSAATQPDYKYKKLSVNAKNIILNHSWPGNVRELHSTLLRASLWASKDKISEMEIKEAMFVHFSKNDSVLTKNFDKSFSIYKVIDELRVYYIDKALKESHGSVTKAAKLLGLPNYQTLSSWIEKYGIN